MQAKRIAAEGGREYIFVRDDDPDIKQEPGIISTSGASWGQPQRGGRGRRGGRRQDLEAMRCMRGPDLKVCVCLADLAMY